MVRLESVFVPLHMLVTRASYFRRRCARRRVLLKTTHYVLMLASRHRAVTVIAGTDISFEVGVPGWMQRRVAEAKPMASPT